MNFSVYMPGSHRIRNDNITDYFDKYIQMKRRLIRKNNML